MSSSTVARGKVFWLIGHSGAGKTTLCMAVRDRLVQRGKLVQVLDGDVLRRGLCSDLGFSPEDRMENARRVAHVANIFAMQGMTVLVGLICPYQAMRELMRSIVPDGVQVFIDAPVSVCEERDPKGLYKLARSGELPGFTGVDSDFEAPLNPDLVCHTDRETVVESTEKILALMQDPDHPAIQGTQTEDGRRRTIAVDFDGVIADYDGWRGDGEFGSPRVDVRNALHSLRREGWKIVVHTARKPSAVEPYLRQADVPFDEINANTDYPALSPRPIATVYWDDRAVCYSGDAMRDLEHIREFRTWTQRM
ncbi:MAG TPA: adenylyl-sulfate kinase [Acidisarcina sp.]